MDASFSLDNATPQDKARLVRMLDDRSRRGRQPSRGAAERIAKLFEDHEARCADLERVEALARGASSTDLA